MFLRPNNFNYKKMDGKVLNGDKQGDEERGKDIRRKQRETVIDYAKSKKILNRRESRVGPSLPLNNYRRN
jgi:hypothetical protein